MKISNNKNKNYHVAKLKSLEIIENLFMYLRDKNSLNLLIKALNQIEDAPNSPMGEKLKFSGQNLDNNWWKGVKATALQAKNEWLSHKDAEIFRKFLL